MNAIPRRVWSLWPKWVRGYKNLGSYWSNVELRERQARLLSY